jgi:hypothetical protein
LAQFGYDVSARRKWLAKDYLFWNKPRAPDVLKGGDA